MKRNGHQVFGVEDKNNSPELKAIKEKYAELWNHIAETESKTEDGDVRRWCALTKTHLEISEAMAAKALTIK